MFQVHIIANKIYAVEVSSLNDSKFRKRIESFASEGTISIVVKNLKDLEKLNIYEEPKIIKL